jgi:hypothetical protein
VWQQEDAMNRLQERFGEVLLQRIASDPHPSTTEMNLFEAVATPDLLVAYTMVLIERIEQDPRPSITMERRVLRLVSSFG